MATRLVCRFVVLGLAVAFLGNSQATSLRAEPAASRWLDELNRLAKYIGHPLPPDALGTIEAASTSGRPEVRALRAALLYRADPVKWGSELPAHFAVHDYASRARGDMIVISQEEFVSRIKKVESSYPSLQSQVVMVVAFIEFRDANLWFTQGDQRLSVARFLRGAFLAQVFKGSSLDPVSVAIQLDQHAREEYERAVKSNR